MLPSSSLSVIYTGRPNVCGLGSNTDHTFRHFRIREFEGVNSMSSSNLSIVFGPTLLGPPPPSMTGEGGGGGTTLQDMNWQCKARSSSIYFHQPLTVGLSGYRDNHRSLQ